MMAVSRATATRAKKKVKAGTSKQSADARKIAFVEAYLSNGMNATEAALEAGYSKGGASKQGYRMSRDPAILSMLRQRQDELAQTHRLTTEDVIAELAKIVHSDPRKLFDADGRMVHPKDWTDDMAGAVASLEVSEDFESGPDGRKPVGLTKKVKLWDKNSAIEKAMKHLGLFERDNEQATAVHAATLTDAQLAAIIHGNQR